MNLTGQTRLLQLVSPSMPIGGFTYSRGLETAVELGWLSDRISVERWASGLLDEIGSLDAPILGRMHQAWTQGDRAAVARWAALSDAARGTRELQEESRRSGASLAKLLRDLGVASTEDTDDPVRHSHLAMFALAAVTLSIDIDVAVHGFLWTWLESTVTAAIKLVPLGQTDGQRVLLTVGERLASVTELALLRQDSEIGAFTPGLCIASALHETQRTRLFRS